MERAAMCASKSIRISDQCRTHIAVRRLAGTLGQGDNPRHSPSRGTNLPVICILCVTHVVMRIASVSLLSEDGQRNAGQLIGLGHHRRRGLYEHVLASHAG